jgi:acyl-lipid (8-3)-desaturase
MAIENKVYDVTSFIPNHPGGKAILKGCGKDATVLFETRPDTDKGPHPESAKQTLTNYLIGDLTTSTTPSTNP